MKSWIRLSGFTFAAAGFLALAAMTAIAAPASAAPNVIIEQVQPDVSGTLVYLPLAPNVQGGARSAQLTVDLYLKNLEASSQTIQSVSVEFPGSTQPTVSLSTGLQMRCPWSSSALTSPLVITSGQTCRLALLPDLRVSLPAPAQATIRVFFASQPTQPVMANRALAAYVADTPTGSFRFPAKANDLPSGAFWSGQSSGAGSHHRMDPIRSMLFAYDMGIVRHDGENWVKWVGDEPSPGRARNEDHLVWGTPVYAMAAGTVIDCQDGNEDNLFGSPSSSWGAPNYVKIDHGEEVGWYFHLKNGSIRPEVCFVGAVVAEGQKLGEVGNSGNSSAPHLHVQVTRGDFGMPLAFNDAFVLERGSSFPNPPLGNAPWSEVRGAGLPWEKTVTWPSGLRRRGDLGGVEIEAVAMASSSSTRKVTVARDAGDNLRVDLWQVQSSGELANLASDTGGGVDAVAAVRPQGTDDVTAVLQTASGALKLIAYDVTGSGLTREAETPDIGAILGVAAAVAPFPKGLATAIRTQSGNLKVIAWRSDAVAGTITRLGEDVAGTTRAVALADTLLFPGVVAAVRTGSDTLRLISFGITTAGFVNREDEEDLLVPILNVSVARVGTSNGRDRVVTAAERLDGKLEVTAWEIDATGHITRLGTATGGTASAISVARISNQHALTVMADSGGELELIAWHIDPAGQLVRRAEGWGGGAKATAVTLSTPFLFGEPTFAVTAVRTANDDLKLINWQILLTD